MLRSSSLTFSVLKQTNRSQSRGLFRWLNSIFNHYDEKKVKELGPNVAAAEWLIRNGAQAKFSKASTLTDYDKLLNEESYKSDQIIEIDATKSAINHVGFPYLEKLHKLNKIILNEAWYIDDKALILLSKYDLPNLHHIELINCNEVTDRGVLSLAQLKHLKYAKLENLPSVQDKRGCLEKLKAELKNCKIVWN